MHVSKKQRKKVKIPWEDDDIREKRAELKTAFLASQKRKTRSSTRELNRAKMALNKAYDRAQEEYIKDKTKIIRTRFF